MKPTPLVMFLLLASIAATAQPQRLSYSVRLTFQGYSLPFRHINENFKNIGGSLGIAYAYNRSQTLSQQVSLGIFNHREHGNSYYANTQFCYQPRLFSAFEPSFAIGIGRVVSFANGRNPYYSAHDGTWEKSSRQFQSHWQVPAAINLGYRIKTKAGFTITPAIGYEAAAFLHYNNAFPILPYSLLTVGSKITLPKHHK